MTREERRNHIISAAKNRFMDSGYHATTTASIAKKAGISEVTLYRYFSSKRNLFREVIEPILAESLENIFLSTNKEKISAIDKLKHILIDRIDFVSQNREMIKLILSERQMNPDIIPFDYIERTHFLLKESAAEAGIELENEDFTLRVLIGSILSFLYFPKKSVQTVEEYVDHLLLHLKE